MAQTFESIMNYPVMDAEGAKKALEEAVKIVKQICRNIPIISSPPTALMVFTKQRRTQNGQQASGQALSGWLMNLPETRHFRKAAEVQVEASMTEFSIRLM